jgi:tetratricopeptide (TPR) repeat protein
LNDKGGPLGSAFFVAGIFKRPHLGGQICLVLRFEVFMIKLLRLTLLMGSMTLAGASPNLSFASGGGEQSWSGTYLAGRTAGRLRDVDAAGSYVSSALSHDPDNIVLIERLFVLKLSAGELAKAEDLAERVITFNSEHRMARLVLGLRDMKAGKYEDARIHFTESAYTPIGELSSSMLKAWTFVGENNLNAALAELKSLEENESFINFKLFHEALAADYLNSRVRADQLYRSASEAAGTSLRVTQAYGSYLERTGKRDQAIKVYQQFLEQNDRNALVIASLKAVQDKTSKPEPLVQSVMDGASEALFSLAAAMNEGDSMEVALIYAQLASAYSRDKAVMLTLLGDVQTGMSRYQTAIESYDAIPKQSPLRGNADTEIALNLQRLERADEAVAKLQDLLKINPQSYTALVTLGNINRANEKYADAEQAYAKAIALFGPENKENWQLYYFQGISLERLKRWSEAEAVFRKALALSPDEASVLNYLGYSLIDRNEKLDEALKMIQKAVELRPNDGYIIDSLGWAYFRLGRFEEAVLELERAVDLKAGDPIIAEHLGDAYWKVGRKLEARFQWQHAKDNDPEKDDLARIEKKLAEGYDAGKAMEDKKAEAQ